MAIDKEKGMLKPSKNNFGLYGANFILYKGPNSRGISFELAEISGKLFFKDPYWPNLVLFLASSTDKYYPYTGQNC